MRERRSSCDRPGHSAGSAGRRSSRHFRHPAQCGVLPHPLDGQKALGAGGLHRRAAGAAGDVLLWCQPHGCQVSLPAYHPSAAVCRAGAAQRAEGLAAGGSAHGLFVLSGAALGGVGGSAVLPAASAGAAGGRAAVHPAAAAVVHPVPCALHAAAFPLPGLGAVPVWHRTVGELSF